MEEELLAVFKDQLDSLGINAEYRVYTGKKYPYLTYEYQETEVTPEDGGTAGEFFCEIWTRNTFLELIQIKEKIKKHFTQLNITVGNNVYHLDYTDSMPDETGEEALKKLQVRVATKFWKGA